MVDRIELVSQLFWFCLVFWGFYMLLVYYVLPYVALGLKMRRKCILKFENGLKKNSKVLYWSENFVGFFSGESLGFIEGSVRQQCTNKFLKSEATFFEEVLSVFNKGESLVTNLNGVRYWGIESRINFYISITERARLYPWIS